MVAGGIGGGIGGFLLAHSQIPALVNGGGEPNIDASAAPMTLAMRALAGFIAGGLLVLIFSLLNSFTRERINNK